MLSFFFRKNFYDGWDNLVSFLVPNLIVDGIVFSSAAVMIAGRENLAVWIACTALIFCLCSIAVLAWTEAAAKIAEGFTVPLKDFFFAVPSCIADGLKYAAALFTLCAATGIGVAFYFLNGATIVGMMAGFAFCWVALIIFTALLWYPALRALLHNPFGKSVKKCFIILTDNALQSLVVAFYNLFLTLVSVVMIGIAPGMAGLALSRVNALRLILKKYDYLNELDKNGTPANSPERRKIPWNTILKNDIESVPPRPFKAFIFPWKE
ncbi:MAG: hypothetical protein ACTTKL_08540 [Treponema sp.]